jgi:hypothetical protein
MFKNRGAPDHECEQGVGRRCRCLPEKNLPEMQLITTPHIEDDNDQQLVYRKVQELHKAHPNLRGILGCAAGSPLDQRFMRDLQSAVILFIQDGMLCLDLPYDSGTMRLQPAF